MSDYYFYHPIEVRYGDLDPQGHVNNAKHLTYFEQARVAYMIHLGLFSTDQSFMKIGVIVADIHITYREPIHFGYNVKVGMRMTKLGNKSMTGEQCVVDVETGKEYSSGEIVMVTFDYQEGKTITVPQVWREKFSTFEHLNV